MLNSLIEAVAESDGLALKPRALAEKLDISLTELAELLQVSRNSLGDASHSPKVQKAIAPVVKILNLATEVSGTERRALLWFKYNPIPSLGTKTPYEHVQDGHADWVLGHIENVMNGVYA